MRDDQIEEVKQYLLSEEQDGALDAIIELERRLANLHSHIKWPDRFVFTNPAENFLQFQCQVKACEVPAELTKHPDTMASQQFVDGWNACRDAMLAVSVQSKN